MNILEMVLHAMRSGDESTLRGSEEGRKFLLGVAKDRKKVPLAVRRLPRLAGESARRFVDDLRLECINSR